MPLRLWPKRSKRKQLETRVRRLEKEKKRFATTLNENPATNVVIIGHTDATGNPGINQPLSVDRAARTRDYLANRGVNPARITIEGRGEREPIASNTDNSGRARNRRVEIFMGEQVAQAPAR